jgi:RNA polymerase sigma-70 factor (ECF subfamily)
MAVPPFDYQASLIACGNGNQEAFQHLYEREAPHMLALSLALLSDQATARDLVRETFVLVWKNASAYSATVGCGRAWIYSILRYRAQGRLRQLPDSTAFDAGRIKELSRLLGQQGKLSASPFRQALSRLGEAQRLPLLMAYFQASNYEQIAARLDEPAESIRAQVRASLEHLQHAVPA